MIHKLIMAVPACEKLVAAACQKLTVPLIVFTAIDQSVVVPVRRKRAGNFFYFVRDSVGLPVQDDPAAENSKYTRQSQLPLKEKSQR